MTAYYNEIDPYAAQWLRNLISAGHIAAGDVDERSIVDVRPDDLAGYEQCHFFAGIGVWSHALRRAGWPDDRPVWTGSCPCQPFSAAGKGGGFADERHLWPSWHWLIGQRRPAIVFGEQVASKDAEPWLDLVQADLEGLDYAVGAVPFPSAGIGAPHIRDRLYWVADNDRDGLSARLWGRSVRAKRYAEHGHCPERLADDDDDDDARLEGRRQPGRERAAQRPAGAGCVAGGLANANGRHAGAERQQRGREQRQQPQDGGAVGLADAASTRHPEARQHERRQPQFSARSAEHGGMVRPAGPTNGLWRDADWLFCRDGKWRPVEPGTFPLAHGAPARVGRLRGYGNAINAEAATAWVETYLDAEDDLRAAA